MPVGPTKSPLYTTGDDLRGTFVLMSASILCLPRPSCMPSVGGATARNIKHSAGAKRALLRGQPRHQRGNFGGLPKASHGNARQHELNMRRGHLLEEVGLHRG